MVSVQADFEPCPASLGISAPCAIKAPRFNITFAAVVYPNITLAQHTQSEPTSDENPQVIDAVTAAPLANLIQLVYASIRIDLGNPSPNNFILNPSSTNQTIAQSFPQTSTLPVAQSNLYQKLTSQSFQPVTIQDPANIRVVYLCRAQRQKSAGPLFIAVLVATLSMFSSGWAVFMFVAAYIAKRPSEGFSLIFYLVNYSPNVPTSLQRTFAKGTLLTAYLPPQITVALLDSTARFNVINQWQPKFL